MDRTVLRLIVALSMILTGLLVIALPHPARLARAVQPEWSPVPVAEVRVDGAPLATPTLSLAPQPAATIGAAWTTYIDRQFCYSLQHPDRIQPRVQELSAHAPAQVKFGDFIHATSYAPPFPDETFARWTENWQTATLANGQPAYRKEFKIPPLEPEGTESLMVQVAIRAGGADHLWVFNSPISDASVDLAVFGQMIASYRPLENCTVDASVALPRVAAVTDGFDFPVDPRDGSSGEPPGYASYNARNPNLNDPNRHYSPCYGKLLSQLQHAGEDWFRGAGSPVYAVANGTVIWSLYHNWPGSVVIIEHQLPAGVNAPWGGDRIYSMYGHLSSSGLIPQWSSVQRGQQIGTVYNWVGNAHLHFEMRRYGNMGQAPQWVNGYYFCNTAGWPGPGYTDTDAHPDWFGYTHPSAWIDSHRPGGGGATATPTPTPVQAPTNTPTRQPTATPTPGAQEIILLEAWPQGASISPGQTFHPRVVVQTSGFNLDCAENFLENRDGNRYGAHPIQGCRDLGGNRYEFAFGDPPMQAPAGAGEYHSQWQVWRYPSHIGPLIDLWFTVNAQPTATPPSGNCTPTNHNAVLYAETNFGGACVALGPGEYPNPGHLNPVGNDNTRSLRVGEYVRLTLYENDNFEGRHSVFDASQVHDLRDSEISYDTSSARVEQRPTPQPTATPTRTPTPTPIPTPTPTVTPPPVLDCPQTFSGWQGEYWDNDALAGVPVLCRDDADIDFDWRDAAPHSQLPDEHFSARWTRTLYFEAGTYRFDVYHDDGARLYVDGIRVLDVWCTNCRQEDSVEQTLAVGRHTLRLEMWENTGWAAARLRWQRLDASDPAPDLYLPSVANIVAPAVGVLANGDFEQGAGGGWNEYSSHGWPLVLSDEFLPVSPYSGHWAGWLGGEHDEIAAIWQEVSVPAATPRLRFAHWIASEDVCGYDFGGVIVDYETVVDVFTLCAESSTGGWVWREVDLRAYAGRRISLQIRAETDGSLNSNLFVDDVGWGAGSPARAVVEGTPVATRTVASHTKAEERLLRSERDSVVPGWLFLWRQTKVR